MIMSRAIVRSLVAAALLGGEAMAASPDLAASPASFVSPASFEHGAPAVNTIVALKKFEGLSQEAD